MAAIKNTFKEQCTDYLTKGMGFEEATAFESYLLEATSDEKRYFNRLRDSFAMMAFESHDIRPSKDLKPRILSAIIPEKTNNVTPIYWKFFATAAMILIILSGVLGYMLLQEKRVKEIQQTRIELLSNELDAHRELFALLQRQGVQIVGLDGLEVNPGGFANIVWDQELREAFMHVSNLPTAPSDKDYQLWLIVDAKPVSAGIFNASSAGGNLFYKINDLNYTPESAVQAFAVTLEPEGGVSQPSGDMFLF
ncbi:MAG TPA: hypothetical protein DCE78_06690, partial [Bacteroidetes bacterium]|nr:hypothetical protein [Bacteroidota bacterium]